MGENNLILKFIHLLQFHDRRISVFYLKGFQRALSTYRQIFALISVVKKRQITCIINKL
ncbi:hypothetical protein NMY3_01778 [Candidatus Nitrosocosmicus oleophilus]|uniref:Uncharacterized protein n=1 Tax=Candidatus Nitrosocosmicus oleophilus TaxID=1353260 RepID=A0A654M0C0_9ARCH|nr:hypothetical protein NMY3_01778 [Candidatus Nitrosocosmicus oleophilus]